MSIQTVKTVTCDICKGLITGQNQRVFLGAYGLDFHASCLGKVDGTIIGLVTDEATVGTSSEFDDKPAHANRLYWNKEVSK